MTSPVFYPDLRQQRTPGISAFPEFDATIVSPELPCGVSWLASCLLELGVALCKPWGINGRENWIQLAGRRYRYECPGSSWSRLVPGLVHGRVFTWRRSPVPRFTHSWPGWFPSTSRQVLFVRDPRDALRSDWLRQRRAGRIGADRDLNHFVELPAEGLPVPRRDALVLFLSAWRYALARTPGGLILRFEDYKSNPTATLDRALSFLAVESDAKSREGALRASDHSEVVRAERRLLATGIVTTPLLGDGRAFAWRDDPEEQRIKPDRAMADLCHWMGYPVDDVVSRPSACTFEDLESALMRHDVAEPEILSTAVMAAIEAAAGKSTDCGAERGTEIRPAPLCASS